MHSDLKPSNIVFKDGKAHLIDFGCGEQLRSGSKKSSNLKGCVLFASPEKLRGKYSFALDLWALGIVLFICLFGYSPFDPTHSRDYQRAMAEITMFGFDPSTRRGFGAFFPKALNISNESKQLIAGLLTSDPKQRLTAEQVLTHPWVVRHCGP